MKWFLALDDLRDTRPLLHALIWWALTWAMYPVLLIGMTLIIALAPPALIVGSLIKRRGECSKTLAELTR
jgi:hypothetical protein